MPKTTSVVQFAGEYNPCRLARQVKESNTPSAAELLHRPHEAAGVAKPREWGADSVSCGTHSPAGQAGRGRTAGSVCHPRSFRTS